jgi:hypothetical protein
VDAIRDEDGSFKLTACREPWVVIDLHKLHRFVIDQEPQPSHDHLSARFEAETFAHLRWSQDGRNLDDLLRGCRLSVS